MPTLARNSEKRFLTALLKTCELGGFFADAWRQTCRVFAEFAAAEHGGLAGLGLAAKGFSREQFLTPSSVSALDAPDGGGKMHGWGWEGLNHGLKGRIMVRTVPGLGALVLASALPLLLVCGCGPSTKVAAGEGPKELDLSRLIVWHTQDCDVVTSRSRGLYKTIQTFYDRSGRRLDGLKLGYLVESHSQTHFSEGLTVAWVDDEKHLSGYVDRAGRVVIPFQFRYACSFSEGRAVAAAHDPNSHAAAYDPNRHRDAREGLIDRRGQWIVPAGKYEKLGSGSEGRWRFRIRTHQDDGQRWGFLDANGTVVIEPKYRKAGAYHEGLSLIDDGNALAFIDRQGSTAFRLPDTTYRAEGFSCGRALVVLHTGKKRGGRDDIFDDPTEMDLQFGFLARDGTMAIKPVYMAAGGFYDGLAPVSMSEKAEFCRVEDETVDGFFGPADDGQRWGFIDPNGKLVIPMKFNRVSWFSEGRARARHNGKWGFIDKAGVFVIPPRFEWVESFENGVAVAVLDGKIILIDREGKTIVNTGTEHAVF
ncbi:MAG TPA: WG repeat-containing protein [Phycisphaerae bacterium]|nr:WG repeat-containing protein [Phycisphaerae bacterium]